MTLDAATLSALASQDSSVEVWHHCPRSQAVAAALSRGLSSSYAMAGQQQVFLGSSSCPLQGLLTHPQVCMIVRLLAWESSAGCHTSCCTRNPPTRNPPSSLPTTAPCLPFLGVRLHVWCAVWCCCRASVGGWCSSRSWGSLWELCRWRCHSHTLEAQHMMTAPLARHPLLGARAGTQIQMRVFNVGRAAGTRAHDKTRCTPAMRKSACLTDPGMRCPLPERAHAGTQSGCSCCPPSLRLRWHPSWRLHPPGLLASWCA